MTPRALPSVLLLVPLSLILSAAEPDKVPAKLAPDVGGEKMATAAQQIRLAGLKCETGVFYIAADKWKDDIPAGSVQLQAPRAKAIVLPDDAVAVWEFKKAAADQKVVDVPDLTGLTAAEVEKKLTEVGLVPTRSTGTDAPAPTGKAVDQYPKAKQPVLAPTAVFVRYR